MFFLSDIMKFLIVFALAFATVWAKDLYSRSIEVPMLDNESRITNGKYADLGQFKYQVGINSKKGRNLLWCGGSLIGNTWVLTAAHCIDGFPEATVYLGSIQRLEGKTCHTVYKKDMIMYPTWNFDTFTDDIGLLRIPKTSETNLIGMVKLPSDDKNNYIGATVVIAGWGRTTDRSKELSKYLKYATLKVTHQIDCLQIYRPLYHNDTNMCVSAPDLESACFGDNGGPLVLAGKNIQIGVFQYNGANGCQNQIPVVFERVGPYLAWIKNQTKIGF